MKSFRKNLCLFSLLVLCFLLAGCSLPFGGVKDTESLLEKVEKNMPKSSHLKADIDGDVVVGSEMGNISVPIKMNMDGDVVNQDAHINADVDMSLFGMSMNMKMEFYVDGDKVYEKSIATMDSSNQSDGWVVSENKSNLSDLVVFKEDVRKALIEKAEFKKEKKGYSLTVDAKDIPVQSDSFGFSDTLGTEESSDMKVEDGIIVYQFDKDCVLSSMTWKDVKMVEKNDSDTQSSMVLNMTIEQSEINKIDKKAVKVPDKVKDSAVKKDDVKDDDSSLDLDDLSEDNSDDTSEEPSDSLSDIFGTTEGTDETVTTTPSGNTMYGSINGVPLNAGKNDFDKTFGADGFTFNAEEDGKYSFTVMDSAKYENISLSLNHKAYGNGTATEKEIRKDGFYGYDINCAFCDTRPDMEWNGLTWGASGEDIKKVYGEPYDISETNSFTTYSYKLSGKIDLNFMVYTSTDQPGTGLQGVSLAVY